jgi:hypothetical protein
VWKQIQKLKDMGYKIKNYIYALLFGTSSILCSG